MYNEINKVTIMGHLGCDPKSSYSAKKQRRTFISVATNRVSIDKDTGEQKTSTQWHQICFFGRLTEIANNFLRKGCHVYIEGSLSTRSWLNAEGQKCYSTNIIGQWLTLLTPKK